MLNFAYIWTNGLKTITKKRRKILMSPNSEIPLPQAKQNYIGDTLAHK